MAGRIRPAFSLLADTKMGTAIAVPFLVFYGVISIGYLKL